MNGVRAAVSDLRSHGFALCKPDSKEKKPTYPGWSTFSLEAADFSDGDMIGIMGGPLSDGGRTGHALVIIDLDALAAVEKADRHLPVTGMVEGRKSKPWSHRYYLVPHDTIPDWAKSHAEQAAPAAEKAKGHPGPFKKQFRHRETKACVIDFIGTGGQVVCPPSQHPGGEYRQWWVGGLTAAPHVVDFLTLWQLVGQLASACGAEIPDVMPRPPAPRVLMSRSAGDPIKRAVKYLDKCDPAIEGQDGSGRLFYATRAVVYGFDLGPEVGLQLLRDHYNPRCIPPWSDAELQHKVQDAERLPFDKPRGWLLNSPAPGLNGKAHKNGKPKTQPAANPPSAATAPVKLSGPGFDDTDIANGQTFVAHNGENVRYLADCGQWAVFDGRRWFLDRSQTQVERLAKETTARMAKEAAAAFLKADSKDKPALNKAQRALQWAKASQDMRLVRRMLQAARSEPAVCVQKVGDVFDARRDLLNCPNGTVELRTGTLREHRREDYISRLCPTQYNPDAPRSTYLSFLSTTFDGKPTVAKYVRELSGYVITGEVSDQTLNIFNGDGSNGKNVLVDNWKATLGEGEYAHTAAAELLVGDGWDRHPTEKTGLRGARLVVCSETGEDGLLDETKMKSLTGGDTVTARYMRGDFFQFEPTHKLVLLTNNRPRVRGTDHGVWRRLRLVPFAVKFWKDADKELDPNGKYPERFKADPTLSERLRTTEAEGILADMVEYAVAFYRAGGTLNPPAEVSAATAEYRKDQDVIGQFFAVRVREDDTGKVRASDFYATFKRWWDAEGYTANKVPGPRKFGIEAKRKFHQTKASGNVYAVRILPVEEWGDGTMGANSSIDTHAGACSGSSSENSLPSSHAPVADPADPADPDAFERWAIEHDDEAR